VAVSKAESSLLPAATPTIAETGIPVIAGPKGTEPASGSLHDIRAESPTPAALVPVPAPAAPKHESAEEEKRRLASLYSPPVQSTSLKSSPAPAPASASTPITSSAGQPQRYESAEDEKMRLEREERERILHRNAPDPPAKDEEELPPYQEPGM